MVDFCIQIVSSLFLLFPIIGIYQLITACYRYFFIKGLNPEYYTKLEKYLMSVMAYFGIFLLIWNIFDLERNVNFNEEITLFYTFIPPLGLAYYYWKIRKYKTTK